MFSKEKKEKLDQGLEKTKTSLFSKISKALVGKSTVDDSFLDELEEILISSDVGIETTLKVIERIQQRVARDKYINSSELHTLLRDEMVKLMEENAIQPALSKDFTSIGKPYVIMVVGVNGVGKTTTIGKLANLFRNEGKKVVLGAGDTFRAAAVEQLRIWSERSGVGFIAHGMNTDPAAVAFDAVKKGVDEGADVVIIDTAGRLHTKVNLMNELSKIRRVVTKIIPEAPHEVLLVLDASTGQNAFEQARQFTAVTDVNALALTKLDGTAKGGVVIGIADQFKIPVKYIGVGEGIDDLQLFNKTEFIDSLFKS
ncbi:MAG: signal recognition particle-docking protein FtsY [Bacteroidia bacterium]|nr:signal recognition particle-docking protein FtsY [Bacteroidia bacterium]